MEEENKPRKVADEVNGSDADGKISRKVSSASLGEDEEDEEKRAMLLGPQIGLKEQLEMDKVMSFLLLFCFY